MHCDIETEAFGSSPVTATRTVSPSTRFSDLVSSTVGLSGRGTDGSKSTATPPDWS